MFTAAAFLLDRFFYRIAQFFAHWYGHSFWRIGGWAVRVLERLDAFFAVRVNARYFLIPLYQDYTVLGRILGVFLRSLRVFSGSVIYFAVAALFFLLYLVWAVIPLYFVLQIIYS